MGLDTNDMTPEPTVNGLELLETVSKFMRELLEFRLRALDEGLVQIPSMISNSLLIDIYMVMNVFQEACNSTNTYEVPWTLEECRNPGTRTAFAPAEPIAPGRSAELLRDRPCNVRDSNERIFCWYFPGVISTERRVHLQAAIADLCERSLKPFGVEPSLNSSTWRLEKSLYKSASECTFTPGAACYSPCWYAQGHPPPEHEPGPSQTLMNNPQNETLLHDVQETTALIGGLLALIQPTVYRRGLQVWKGLSQNSYDTRHPARVAALLRIWASPFTALSIISNRETPIHKDTQGAQNVFDALLTFGNYEDGRFEIPEAGMRFRYDSGTLIFLESRSLKHGASTVVGERCCMVMFFRPHMLRYGLKEEDPEQEPMPTMGELRNAILKV